MRADCRFYGVGQGLCYGCRIYDEHDKGIFRFVYDCGSFYKKDNTALVDEIAMMKSDPKQTLDALFVSHFDMDHISGIPALFDAFDVKNVFIPYFSPAELALLALTAGEELDDRCIDLYEDPIAFFERMGCKNLYILFPERQDIGYQNSNSNYLFEGAGFQIQDGDALPHIGITGNKGMRVVDCYGTLDLQHYRTGWQFRIYQDQDERTQQELHGKIGNLMGLPTWKREDLKLLLKDNALRNQAKEIYKKVKHGINQSSLVLYHAPSQKGADIRTLRDLHRCFCKDCYMPRRHCLGWHDVGTLLTGDIDLTKLKNKGTDLEKFLNECPHDIGVFLLPHHGSGKNTSIQYLKKALKSRHLFFPCSYGRGNRFGHPDPYMLDKVMMELHGEVVHVVRDEDFRYEVHVYKTTGATV